MSPLQVSALGMRLFAIWLAIYWARSLPTLFTELRAWAPEGVTTTVVPVVFTVVLVGFALLLWFFPRTIARTLLPEENTLAPPAPAAPSAWFAVGSALIALWVFASVLPGIFQQGYIFIDAKRNNIVLPEYWESWLIYYVVQFAVGVWLLLGAAGARRFLLWARNARFD